MSLNTISGRDGICNPSADFFMSAHFMLWVLAAVSFQGPKEKSRWLLWKPRIVIAEVGPVWATQALQCAPVPHLPAAQPLP